MLRFLSSAAAVAMISTSALAADLPMPPEAMPVAAPLSGYSWTGFYVGAYGGWAFGDWEAENSAGDLFDDAPPGGLTFDLEPDGAIVGGTVGFNWQTNWLVFGVEGEGGHNFADDSEAVFVADGANGILDDDFGDVEYGWYGTFAGRVGVGLDRLLLFAKGGGALTEVDQSAGDLDAGAIDPTDIASDDDVLFGFVVGAGAEYALTDQISLKAEYNFMDFEDVDATNGDGDTATFESQFHVVKGGLNWKF